MTPVKLPPRKPSWYKNGKQKQHPLYRSLIDSKSRCTNPNVPAYKTYKNRKYLLGSYVDAFWRLIDAWEQCKKKHESASIDRIDNDDDYTWENVQIIPKEENTRKDKCGKKHHFWGKKRSATSKKKMSETQKGDKNHMWGRLGKDNPTSKAVRCVETGKVYGSMHEAERKTGICNSDISKCCSGKLKTAGGYCWRRV